MADHVHWFHALWDHFGPYAKRADFHFHPCCEDDCGAFLVGVGRDCGGRATRHRVWRETPPTPAVQGATP